MVLGRAAPGPWNFGLSRQLTQAPQSLALHPSQEPQRARRLFSTFARSCTSIPTSSPSVLARSVEYPRSPRCQRPDARDTEPGLARGLARNARIGRPRRREARQRGGQRTRRARAAMPVGARGRAGCAHPMMDFLPLYAAQVAPARLYAFAVSRVGRQALVHSRLRPGLIAVDSLRFPFSLEIMRF